MNTVSGYVFHCSKCRFPHAGECITENPCVAGSIGADVVVRTPIINGIPTVGSMWHAEISSFPGMGWIGSVGYDFYVIRDYDAMNNKVCYYNQLDPTQNYYMDPCAWTSAGDEIRGSSGARVRMVPA